MDVVVFGAGSLGSLLGGLLARAHDVTLVGRHRHVERVRREGLRVTGAVEATVFPDARTDAPASADLALVTVKAYDTAAAASALADTDLDATLSLQNGLGNERRLAEALDAPALAGTCTYGARLVGPGEVACTGVGEVVLGAREGGASTLADRVGAAFTEADVATTVADDMPRRLWEKLAVNAGINAPTALARIQNGSLLDGDVADLTRTAACEVAAAARADGVDLTDDAAVNAVERVARATADNRSSMLQDVEKARRTEVDSINGVVSGPDAPVNRTLTALLRAWERERGLRE
ncbi:ketopantoate reductase family protein [Halomarina rubra]|uniref:2-dehydropantoate 2-reductase n=1 Tax=Halomarina rubra TaxID=2071873 RepID=A0ABD6AW01_9EURY|nr:ketopantoate reductase family protein [Halomarina rubra]